MSHIQGKVVVVTGASSGLGEAVAIEFARRGSLMVLGARRLERLEVLVSRIEAQGGRAIAVECDVRSEDSVKQLFAAGLEAFERIDVLINNAGMADHTPTDELSLETWSNVLQTNLTGAFLCAREAFKIMKQQKCGRIINIGSLSAQVPRPNTIAYAASKFGLDGLNHSLAIDGRAHGIASSIYHPGIIGTDLVSTGPGATAGPAHDPTSRMGADTAACTIVAMADLPDHVNFLTATMLPLSMPFLGRG